MARSSAYQYSVFVNCPFDVRYRGLLRAMVFAVIDCGFEPRCAWEIVSSGSDRLDKLFRLMAECKFGIHDLSRTQVDSKTGLPRFNMPFELGVFLGAKRFGRNQQRKKSCIVLDTESYRYRKFISDIGGCDVLAHGNNVESLIRTIRDWLGTYSKRLIPGGKTVFRKYQRFLKQLPSQSRALDIEYSELTYMDFRLLAEEWLDFYEEERVA